MNQLSFLEPEPVTPEQARIDLIENLPEPDGYVFRSLCIRATTLKDVREEVEAVRQYAGGTLSASDVITALRRLEDLGLISIGKEKDGGEIRRLTQ